MRFPDRNSSGIVFLLVLALVEFFKPGHFTHCVASRRRSLLVSGSSLDGGQQLEAGLDEIRQSPTDGGPLLMIVRPPAIGEREVIDVGELDVAEGLVGDTWATRGSSRTPDGKANPAAQVTMINSRLLALLAQAEEWWQLSGDQLVIDMDMSIENLPPGTRLSIGSALIKVSAEPHTGCAKFVERFGRDALRFIHTPTGRRLRLRGVNTQVVQSGTIRVGDFAIKFSE